MMGSVTSLQYQRVIDRQTDGQTYTVHTSAVNNALHNTQ